jgi:hypothetical protein
MKTKTPVSKTAPGAGLALMLVALAIEVSSSVVCAAAPVSLTLKGIWPGHARGLAEDVAVQGQYAYFGLTAGNEDGLANLNEGALLILDV